MKDKQEITETICFDTRVFDKLTDEYFMIKQSERLAKEINLLRPMNVTEELK